MKKPPTLEELINYCKFRCNDIDVDQFMAYYEDADPPWSVPKRVNGKMARVPMTSWRSSVITWEKISGATTSFNAIKQRDEDYAKKKKVYMKPVKTKPAKSNPVISELIKESYALAGSLRNMTKSSRISARIKMRDIGKQIQVIREQDMRIGRYL